MDETTLRLRPRTSPNERGFLSGGTANLSRRIEAPDESRYPDLIAFDFSKGVLSLCALGKLMCGVPQVGKHCDDLLYLVYLRYFHNGLDQRSFLPNSSFLPAIFLEADA